MLKTVRMLAAIVIMLTAVTMWLDFTAEKRDRHNARIAESGVMLDGSAFIIPDMSKNPPEAVARISSFAACLFVGALLAASAGRDEDET